MKKRFRGFHAAGDALDALGLERQTCRVLGCDSPTMLVARSKGGSTGLRRSSGAYCHLHKSLITRARRCGHGDIELTTKALSAFKYENMTPSLFAAMNASRAKDGLPPVQSNSGVKQ